MSQSDRNDPSGLITIGITTFNAADTLDRALESALRQTWKRIEILVVDDCSTDSSLSLLTRRAETINGIRVFSNLANAGVAASRNRIIAEAKGEFIAFFDDDDVSDPTRLEKQLQRILQYEARFAHGEPVICHTARTLVHEDGLSYCAPTMGEREGRRAPSGLDVARRILLGTPLEDGYGAMPTCSQMARTTTYRVLGGFDVELRRSEDTEFNIRLALHDGHFLGLSEPLVTQFMTKSSEKSLKEELRNLRLVMQKHRAVMEAEGLYEFCIRWLDAKHLLLEGDRLAFVKAMAIIATRWPSATYRRLAASRRNLSLNLAFSKFHR